jgi:hypothetical protein
MEMEQARALGPLMYLADSAAKHGARLGTFDQKTAHAAVDVVG